EVELPNHVRTISRMIAAPNRPASWTEKEVDQATKFGRPDQSNVRDQAAGNLSLDPGGEIEHQIVGLAPRHPDKSHEPPERDSAPPIGGPESAQIYEGGEAGDCQHLARRSRSCDDQPCPGIGSLESL